MLRRLLIILFFSFAFLSVVFSKPEGGKLHSAAKQYELSFWGIYDLKEVYSPIIENFQKQYPQISVQYKQFPNAQEYHEILKSALARGKGPDIFLFSSEHLDEYSQYINPTNKSASEGFAPLVEQDLVKDRLLYGLPLWIDSLMIYYNNRYYKEGIAEKWYDFAEQTRGISIGGIASGRLDNLKAGWDILKALFLQKEVVLTGEPANAVYDTLEFFTRFAYPIDRYFNWSETLNKDYPDEEIDSFAREKVAAIAGYSPVYDFVGIKSQQLAEQGVRRIKEENISVAAFPQLQEDPKYLAKYYALSVSIHSPLPNQAWEFIRLLTDETHAEYYSQATGRASGRILPVQESDSPLRKVQKQQAQHSYVYRISESARETIEQVVERGLKDKRLLREILEVNF